MKVRVVGHEGQCVFPREESGAWNDFFLQLEENGIHIESSNYGAKIDLLIANTHSVQAIEEANKSNLPLERRVLILWEPPVVDDERHSKAVIDQYGVVFSPTPNWAKNAKRRIIFPWPQSVPNLINESFVNWCNRQDRMLFIQGNKYSAHRDELYSFRRNLMRSISANQNLPNPILFGTNWNLGIIFDFRKWFASFIRISKWNFSKSSINGLGFKYPYYEGSILNKFEISRKFKYSIVVENSADYVSEKLFDMVFSGCLTFYLGPDLQDFGFNFPEILSLNNNIDESIIKIMEVISMSNKEKFKILQLQMSEAFNVAPYVQNSYVLRNIANNILQIVS